MNPHSTNTVRFAKLIGRTRKAGDAIKKPIDVKIWKRLELTLTDGSKLEFAFDETPDGWIEVYSDGELAIRSCVTNILYVGNFKRE